MQPLMIFIKRLTSMLLIGLMLSSTFVAYAEYDPEHPELLTEEDIADGKTSYEQGRTVIYAIAQGKDAGTAQNYDAGWAHNFAIPLELWLSDDGKEVIREPIKEIESLREETLYSYSGTGKTADEINSEISGIRGDLLEIRAKILSRSRSEKIPMALPEVLMAQSRSSMERSSRIPSSP